MPIVESNPADDGRTTGPTSMVMCARITLTTADEADVPTARIKELRPFAAAVSVIGTAPMMSAGMAA